MWHLITVITHPMIAYLIYLNSGNAIAALTGLVVGLFSWIVLQAIE